MSYKYNYKIIIIKFFGLITPKVKIWLRNYSECFCISSKNTRNLQTLNQESYLSYVKPNQKLCLIRNQAKKNCPNSAIEKTYAKVNDAGKLLINKTNPRAEEGKYPFWHYI